MKTVYCSAAQRAGPENSRNQRTQNARSAGFTMVELLVVLAILVLIAVIAVPQTIKYLDRARTDSARIAIENIGTALDLYRLDVGRYPTEEEGLIALVEPVDGVARWRGPYLKKKSMLEDPWGTVYEYRVPGDHGAYDLLSLGADGAEGGDDANQDVVSWE